MREFLKDFFSKRDGIPRTVRAVALGLAAAALTPQGQAAIAAALGPYGWIVPLAGALVGGLVAVGEKNANGVAQGGSDQG